MALTKFLQANINHCARAQDLLLESMAQWNIKVAVVAEPYAVPDRGDWLGDLDNSVAIIAPTSAGFESIRRGSGYALGVVDGVAIIGVYAPPSRSLADFEVMLGEIGALIAQVPSRSVLVAGDFNAKSTTWGAPTTNARGELMEEWVVATGLCLLNRGAVNTCVRWNGGSIVDVALASHNLRSRVRGWRVLTDVETLSDHRYIRFDVSSSRSNASDPMVSIRTGPRWVLSRMDAEIAEEAAIVEEWIHQPHEPALSVDDEAEGIRESLTRICDAAMPSAKPFRPRQHLYWWRPELRDLRDACVRSRRQYTRYRRRRRKDQAVEIGLYDSYRSACKALQAGIARAKESCWEEWLQTLDRDPWGRPYRAVRKKLRAWAPPLTTSLQPQLLERVVECLFPQRSEWSPPSMGVAEPRLAESGVPPVTEAEFRAAIAGLKSKRTAPGPDGVPGKLLSLAMGRMGSRTRALFDRCLEQGRFPQVWKTGRLVLLKKDGRSAEQPSAYRPIVLLDEISKVFERVLVTRITQSMNPGLHEAQFGFRRGRSTVAAIAHLRDLTESVVSRGGVLWAISLDVSNAFNSLPWETVKAALAYHSVPRYLQSLIADYFAGRAVEFPTCGGGWARRSMSCGVPQGSVLGPLLWNIGYDWVLRGATLPGVSVICYADDTLVTVRADDNREAGRLATASVAQVVARIRALGLEVALEKTEVLAFHRPRGAPPRGTSIVVGGTSIVVGSTMKYLGIVLDGRWKFDEHLRRLAPRLLAAAGALGRLLPNLGGPSDKCRRLYTGVVRSMALYGAPIWADALCARNVPLIRRPQRAIALRAARAYRTVSFTASCLLASSPPWELEAEVQASVFWRVKEARLRGEPPLPQEVVRWRSAARDDLFQKWSASLEDPEVSRELVAAIRPGLRGWVDRKHGAVSFHLAQMLTGHGCFGRYLCRVLGREPTSGCHHCDVGAEDTAEHTRVACPAWSAERSALSAVIGADLSLPALIVAMVGSEESWDAVSTFCSAVMLRKEAAERQRERDPNSLPARRGRRGRRRRAYLANLPP